MYDLGKSIYEYRKNKQLTQKQIAETIGCSHSSISKLEAGTYNPSEQLEAQILQLLNINRQENHLLSAQLSSWQRSIRQHNFKEADDMYQQLIKFPVSYFYNLTSSFNLHSLQHHLLFFNIKEATKLIPTVETEVNRLSTTASQPYHKALGYYYILTNQLQNAKHHLHRVVDENDGEWHNYLAFLYYKLEKIPHSMEHSQQATAISQQKMDHPNLMFSHTIKAMIDLYLGKYELVKENVQYLLQQPFGLNKGFLQYILSLVYTKQQNYNSALRHMKKANYYEKDTFTKVMYLYEIAYIYTLDSNKKQALSYIEGGIALKANKTYQYKLWKLREITLGNGRTAGFQRKLTDEVLPFFKQNGDDVEVNNCLHLMGEMQSLNQNYKKSSYYFSQSTGNELIAEFLKNYPQK